MDLKAIMAIEFSPSEIPGHLTATVSYVNDEGTVLYTTAPYVVSVGKVLAFGPFGLRVTWMSAMALTAKGAIANVLAHTGDNI